MFVALSKVNFTFRFVSRIVNNQTINNKIILHHLKCRYSYYYYKLFHFLVLPKIEDISMNKFIVITPASLVIMNSQYRTGNTVAK